MKQPSFAIYVLIDGVIGLVLALTTFPPQRLSWSTVIYASVVVSVVLGLGIGFFARWRRKRRQT